jgi:thiamine biosynthesis lipoprotein ApbE
MSFRAPLRWACAAGALLIATMCRGAAAAETFVFHHEDVMGTSMELRLLADSEDLARRAEARALREIDRLSSIFSGYDPRSEFSRWQASHHTPVRIAPELFEVLQSCDRWRAISGGAFDPRIEALMRVWSRCERAGRRPTPAEIAVARASMDRPAWRLDLATMTAERLSDCPLTLNAIAKGYIVERACDAAMDDGGGSGIRGVLLNIGGDLRVRGALDRLIGIADPRADSETSTPIAYIAVRDKAVSTSGRSQRGFRIGGRWYSHKLDPHMGTPVEAVASATVIADRSADADALATIFNVLPPEDSVRLARTLPGVECLVVSADGRVTRSDGWRRYERPAPEPMALEPEPAAAQRDAWGDSFELLVTLEINRPSTGRRRYQRPYLAVWIEDKDGVPVRTLTLWVTASKHGSKWIPDLRRWYRGDRARRLVADIDRLATIARPTREPGRYEIIWDGKDDQGQPVGRGEYTLSIEAAREHGTYQIIRQAIRLDDRPFGKDLKGNTEIKSASVECRRKTSGINPADHPARTSPGRG